MRPLALTERFWTKVDLFGPLWNSTPCWIWLAAKDKDGYGLFGVSKTSRRAHRLSYEWLVSLIPLGLTVDHLCRVHACVNPTHMEIVTMKVNVLRGDGPTARQARQTHCLRGHPFDQANTYIDKRGFRSCKECNRLWPIENRMRYRALGRERTRRYRARQKALHR